MTENEKRKDWTKIEVETIKRYMPKIILGFIIIIPLIYIVCWGWINLANINQDANSGITIEHRSYEKNITNITEEKNIGIETQEEINANTSKLLINSLPFLLFVFISFKIFKKIKKIFDD